MNAPFLWSVVPFLAGCLLIPFARVRRLTAAVGFLLCAVLAAIAASIPINSMIIFGSDASLIFTDSMQVLGRRQVLSRVLQLLLYLCSRLSRQFGSSLPVVASPHHFFAPLALMQTGLIIGAISVSPFIYGAFFLQF